MEEIQEETPIEEQETPVAETKEEETASEEKVPSTEEEEQEETEDPETVPYGRFKEVYGSLKRTERELAKVRSQDTETQPKPTETDKPQLDDYESYEEYTEAITDWKLDRWDNKRNNEVIQAELEKTQKNWDNQVAAAVAKDPKFLEKGFIPTELVDVISGTDRLADFAYYFGDNPAEMTRITGLTKMQAAKEIGKLEAKFENKAPPQRSTTNAPNPTKPVGGKETPKKNPDDMDYDEYKAWRANGGGK